MSTSSSTSSTQSDIDVCDEQSKQWNGILPFRIIDPQRNFPVNCDNILKYVAPEWKRSKIYFPVDIYTVDIETNGPGWIKLKKDLCNAAWKNGQCLVSNGGGKKARRFLCASFCCYKRNLPEHNS